MIQVSLQGNKAIKVIPSDTILIPNILPIFSTTAVTGTTALTIPVGNVDPILSVKVGDTVYNTTNNEIALVGSVASMTINLAASASFTAGAKSIVVYQTPTAAGGGNTQLNGYIIYVGVTGNVSVVMMDGSTVVFTAVPVGWFQIPVKQVNATGTTATSIVAVPYL